jgi:hypothetical protein
MARLLQGKLAGPPRAIAVGNFAGRPRQQLIAGCTTLDVIGQIHRFLGGQGDLPYWIPERVRATGMFHLLPEGSSHLGDDNP